MSTMPSPGRPSPAAADFSAFTCECRLAVADPSVLGPALARLTGFLDRVDEAASRFRPDSEINRLQRAGGGDLSPLLAQLLAAALDAAERSHGDVVPTLGSELSRLGFGPACAPTEEVTHASLERPLVPTLIPATSWRHIELDGRTLRLPRGVALDLGATAKAAAADIAARDLHEAFDTSVLVSLGGDIATAGNERWEVLVQDLPDDPASQVSLTGGWALATSSTQKRRRGLGAASAHHILDPWTSLPAPAAWRSVSVAAPDCVSANMASTAAVVRGPGAVGWLRGLGYPARLVRADGGVLELNGWPAEPEHHLAAGAAR